MVNSRQIPFLLLVAIIAHNNHVSAFQLRAFYLPGQTRPVGAAAPSTTTAASASTTSASASTTEASIATTVSPGDSTTSASASTTDSSASSTSAPTPSNPTFSSDFFLLLINDYRNMHSSTPALTWDTTLASLAQICADGYANPGIKDNTLDSLKGVNYCADTGDGIDYFYTGTTGLGGISMMLNAWYAEGTTPLGSSTTPYNYETPVVTADVTESYQHFTQMLWKATTKVGCAFSKEENKAAAGQRITTCIFSPAGNSAPNGRNTAYKANVLALPSAATTTTASSATA